MVSEYALDLALSHRKYLTFIIGGGIGLALSLIVTYAFTTLFSLWHMASYVFGLAVSTIFTFSYHRKVTFNTQDRIKDRFLKFVVITIGLVTLNWLVVLAVTETTLMHYLVAIVAVTFGISIINYYSNKLWVFKVEKADMIEKPA